MGFFSTAKSAPVANPPPANEHELAHVIAATRALLDDASEVDRLLRVGGEEPLTDGQVRRWLSGRDWEPARAARDLAAHALWRAEYAPQGRVLDCEVANELAQNKVLIQGLDRHGRAVVTVLGAQHVPRPDQTEVQRFFCYTTDAAIELADPVLNPDGHVVYILDVSNYRWRNFDVGAAMTMFDMIRAHYVERLSVLYIHNAAVVVKQLYKLVSPFIHPVTRSKIMFLPDDPAAAAAILAKQIDPKILPPSMGGTGEPKPVEAAWALIEERRVSGRRALAATEPAAAAVDGPSESPSAADAAGMVQEVLVDIIPRGSAAAAVAKEGLELPQAVVARA